MRKYRLIILFLTLLPLTAVAQKHTQFVGLSLEQSPATLVEQLVDKGLQQEDSCELSGRIAGLDMWVTIEGCKDSVGCNYLMLTTQEQQGATQQSDYSTLMRWMQKHYGKPDWEGRVRSQQFARWFVDFDHDIVMIATASTAVEIWFYDNHQTRNLDYYAILKYCERHPAPDVPFYTARESVVWKSTTPVVSTRKNIHKRQPRAKRQHRNTRHRKHRRRR